MKIAFWSEDEQSGTTSNMLASAAMISILYPHAEISVQSLSVLKNTAGAPKKVQEDSADFCFVDCGAGMDEKKCQILQQMDVVVVNLKQEKESLDRFFMADIHKVPKFLILLGNFHGYDPYNRAYLERVYRIAPESLGVISNNSEFFHAHEIGKVRRFIKAEHGDTTNMRNEQLLEELEQFSKQIIKKLEEKY